MRRMIKWMQQRLIFLKLKPISKATRKPLRDEGEPWYPKKSGPATGAWADKYLLLIYASSAIEDYTPSKAAMYNYFL